MTEAIRLGKREEDCRTPDTFTQPPSSLRSVRLRRIVFAMGFLGSTTVRWRWNAGPDSPAHGPWKEGCLLSSRSGLPSTPSKSDPEETLDLADRIEDRRARAAREQQADRTVVGVHD